MSEDVHPACSVTEKEPVRLFSNTDDELLFQVNVRIGDQVDFLFRFCELVMKNSFDIVSGLITTEGKVSQGQFEVRKPGPEQSGASDAAALLGRELEGLVRDMEESPHTPDRDSRKLEKLSITPDLISVSSFREVFSEPDNLAYQLEVEGLNQTGLLAYLSLIMFRSGFSISKLQMQASNRKGASFLFDLTTTISTNAHRILRSYLDVPVPENARGRASSNTSIVQPTPTTQVQMDGLLWSPCDDASEERSTCASVEGSVMSSPGDSNVKSSPRNGTKSPLDGCPAKLHPPPKLPPPSPKVTEPHQPEPHQHLINLSNGDVYQGECVESAEGLRQHGFGTYWYHGQAHASFMQYRGQWREGKKHGQGVLLFHSGGSYAGEWLDNKMHGAGVMHDYAEGSNGTVMPTYSYEGEWRSNAKDGLGVEETEDAVFFGRFSRGQQQGTGVRVRFLSGVVLGCEVLDGSQWRPLLDVLEERTTLTPARRSTDDSLPREESTESMPTKLHDPLAMPPGEPAQIQGSLKWMTSPTCSPAASPTLGPRPAPQGASNLPLSPGGGNSAPASPSSPSGHRRVVVAPPAVNGHDPLDSIEFHLDIQEETLAPARPAPSKCSSKSPSRPHAADGLAEAAQDALSPRWREGHEHQDGDPSLRPLARLGHRRQDSDPSAGRLPSRSLQGKAKATARLLMSPMLWSEHELAAFLSCLGIGPGPVNRVRQRRLRGPDHLVHMTDAELQRRFGLVTPVERHVVRRAVKRFLELDRHENSVRGHRCVDAMEDPILCEFTVPLQELELGAELSAGGFGQVFRGVLRPKADRGGIRLGETLTVAAKAMKGDRHVRLNELLKESRVMATLDHNNLCKFIGICADSRRKGGVQYILSELMDCSLFDLVHKAHRLRWTGTLDVVCALSISDGVCRGLDYLHSKRLVHADLKSPNVLINFTSVPSQPQPKICDFGHAVLRTHPAPHSRCGTPHWAAPEALRSEAVGPAADVFSWAVLLWEMLAQAVPHRNLTFGQVVGAVGWAGWTPDMESLPEVPLNLRQLILQCWAFAPAERPPVESVRIQLHKIRRRPRKDTLGMIAGFLGVWTC